MLVALPYETITFLPLYVGVEKGFFAEEGVAIDYMYVLSGGKRKTVRLLTSGDVQFVTAISTAIEAVLRDWGALKAVCASSYRPYLVQARPGITSPEDLKGKTVMVGGGASTNELLALCRRQGWVPDRDIRLVDGDEVDRITAFQDPHIDAVAARTHYRAWGRKAGFHELRHSDPRIVWHDGGLATTVQMIEERPEVVQAVVRAWVRGSDYAVTHREESIEIAERNIRYMDRERAADAYDAVRDCFRSDISTPGVSYMVDVLRAAKQVAKNVSFQEVVELRFLQQALAERPR